MTVRILERVWAHSKHGGTELLMLLAIADFADEHGSAYPSVSTLAARCRMSDRNANHLLAKLAANGELEIQRNAGPRGTNRYCIVLPDAKGVKRTSPPNSRKPLKPASPPTPEAHFTPEARDTLKPVAEGGEARSRKPLKPASPEPSLNRQEPSIGRAPRRESDPVEQKPKQLALRQLLAEGVSEAVAVEFLALRKTKRAPLTPLAWSGIKTQSAAAGWSLDQALRKCIERGWRSFEADWVRSDRSVPRRAAQELLHADETFSGASS